MIGDDHERSGLRDTREALVAPGIAETSLLHRGGEEIRTSGHMDTLKEGIEGTDFEEAVEDRFRPGQRAEIGLKFVGIAGSARR